LRRFQKKQSVKEGRGKGRLPRNWGRKGGGGCFPVCAQIRKIEEVKEEKAKKRERKRVPLDSMTS